MDETESRFSRQEVKTLCEKAAAAGAAKLHAEIERAAKARKAEQYRNTKTLLDNYRRIKACADGDGKGADILDGVELRRGNERITLAGIGENALCVLAGHLDRMLNAYGDFCAGAASPVMNRRYGVLCCLYIDAERMTAKQAACQLNVTPRQIHADAKAAREDMRQLLYGVSAFLEDLQ